MQRLAGYLRQNRGSYAGLNCAPSAHIAMNNSGYNNPAHWRTKPNPVVSSSANLSLLGGSNMSATNFGVHNYSKLGRLGPADSRFRGF